jgi:uncharacterized membrane protein YoaK (UPF0700 family)
MIAAARLPVVHQPVALLLALSATAGATDAIAFLALDGLFTAHITGNIVILASQVVTRGNADLAELISVPVFMLALALARLLGLSLARHGKHSALDLLLLLQILLLLGFFLLGLRIGPRDSIPTSPCRCSRVCWASWPWRCRTPWSRPSCPALPPPRY